MKKFDHRSKIEYIVLISVKYVFVKWVNKSSPKIFKLIISKWQNQLIFTEKWILFMNIKLWEIILFSNETFCNNWKKLKWIFWSVVKVVSLNARAGIQILNGLVCLTKVLGANHVYEEMAFLIALYIQLTHPFCRLPIIYI